MAGNDAVELEISELLTDITSVVRASYIVTHIKKFLDIIDEADSIYANFPRVLKDQLECEECEHDISLSSEAKGKLALAFAQIGSEVRHSVRLMLEETQQYVDVWSSDCDDAPNSSLYGMLDPNDITVISEMLGFVQKVGKKSVRHLLNFLEAVNGDEHAYLLIKGHGRSSEIRFRYVVDESTLTHFEL